ncbi:nucleoside hydrolase [Streptomyces liangshanensis]|uniref:Nucleoside hydrolase n=1 Tax=Streptomyces liangshanensis TaxID=2717324 RepID=A0A6G9H7B9_9ACTN|nr:nucleoside hydrolase [Streptomyces liangshanensis]QIQ06111.1 nucleoside hydrolase [Streptomyces liangshanensis]
MTATRRIVIDTDPGLGEPGSDIDDGLAIALALRSPEVTVEALTVVNGNVDVDTGVDVARRLGERLGHPDLPVVRGADRPLLRDMAPVRALFDDVIEDHPVRTAAEDRLGPTTDVTAAEYLVELAAAFPGEISVLAIGPMTNLALALRLDPGFAKNVAEIVMMAGSATGYAQNITVVGDFNAYVDPEALAIVLAGGAKLRMVGIDQTSRVRLTRDDAAVLSRGDAFGRWAGECALAWIEFLSRAFPLREEHRDACFLHDPLVVAAFLDPSLCTWADAHVVTDTTSELARGLVVADRGLALAPPPGPPNASVAVDTDVPGFGRLFLDRLTGTSAGD